MPAKLTDMKKSPFRTLLFCFNTRLDKNFMDKLSTAAKKHYDPSLGSTVGPILAYFCSIPLLLVLLLLLLSEPGKKKAKIDRNRVLPLTESYSYSMRTWGSDSITKRIAKGEKVAVLAFYRDADFSNTPLLVEAANGDRFDLPRQYLDYSGLNELDMFSDLPESNPRRSTYKSTSKLRGMVVGKSLEEIEKKLSFADQVMTVPSTGESYAAFRAFDYDNKNEYTALRIKFNPKGEATEYAFLEETPLPSTMKARAKLPAWNTFYHWDANKTLYVLQKESDSALSRFMDSEVMQVLVLLGLFAFMILFPVFVSICLLSPLLKTRVFSNEMMGNLFYIPVFLLYYLFFVYSLVVMPGSMSFYINIIVFGACYLIIVCYYCRKVKETIIINRCTGCAAWDSCYLTDSEVWGSGVETTTTTTYRVNANNPSDRTRTGESRSSRPYTDMTYYYKCEHCGQIRKFESRSYG